MNEFNDRFTVILDANVLAKSLHRNIVLSLAYEGFFRPRWTTRILDEAERGIMRITKGEADSRAQRLQIENAFEQSMIKNYLEYERGLDLKDPDDNHVLAAAIAVSAPLIITDNLKDFESSKLAKYSVEAVSSDNFIADILDLYQVAALFTIEEMRKEMEKPPMNRSELIALMRKHMLPKTATLIEGNLHLLE